MFSIPKYNNLRSDKKEIEDLLKLLTNVIQADSFNINRNFVLISKIENTQTMLDLEYDRSDVVDVLLQLKLSNYSETLIDIQDQNPPLLYVFGFFIDNREIYIKIKVRQGPESAVVCVSFHWAKHPMAYPYK